MPNTGAAMQSVLRVRVQDLGLDPSLTVLCAGYEQSAWRAPALVDDLFQRHLASFALSYTEYNSIDGENAARSLKRAAQMVYSTDKYRRRGEFGELILHAALIDFFGAQPAVSKIYYKDSDNDTVKGFDSVHIVEASETIEIWLGEAKFYKDPSSAISEAIASLNDHLASKFLRREFVAITNKLDRSWPHSEAVHQMLDDARSLDEISESLVMPVLVTYDSGAVNAWNQICPEYVAELEEEARAIWDRFDTDKIASRMKIAIQLILVPLRSKDDFLTLMHQKLDAYQAL
ncbi:DUF1837 domain-containing protein [Cellulomonas sp. WB94]|uniref:HamA C-terminal domain-containing protein n=1 Tax=Cellulomonas sp. WB94 TaxID=2173174 RepID=UPI000D587C86|nr:DUF1837 domain-containing protein [Cellulomonas sp. WB94]PVU82262.1 DUF1837 domain-containing protein [Cellulomonas sp. WB94]